MAFSRKMILQRAAAARVDAATPDAQPEEAKTKATSERRQGRSKKDAGFNPRPMDRLVLWAPLSVVGIPVTQASQRVVNFPSGTPCVALGAPRAAWKGKEQLLDIRVDTDEGPMDGWIRAAHARMAPEEQQEETT